MKITFWRASWVERGQEMCQDFKNPIDIAHIILRNDIVKILIEEKEIETQKTV